MIQFFIEVIVSNFCQTSTKSWNCIKVVCGWGHTLVLTDKEVYAWGSNKHGQCGVGTKDHLSVPLPISDLRGCNIVDIAAGSTHSMALSAQGQG